jgi:hypothetical protein
MGEPQQASRKGENSIEQQIREAIERGDFDHLPGSGRPLDLSENPYTPADWRMAYKILQDAGMAPDWIEQDKEIRREHCTERAAQASSRVAACQARPIEQIASG